MSAPVSASGWVGLSQAYEAHVSRRPLSSTEPEIAFGRRLSGNRAA